MLKAVNHNVKSSFTTVWKVGAGGEVGFEAQGSFTLDWGDGTRVDVIGDNNLVGHDYGETYKHVYVKKGEYTITLSDTVEKFSINLSTAKKLIEIKQWGTAQWNTMMEMFIGARNMVCTATDTPDTSKVLEMGCMFYGCHKFNSPIAHWDTSKVEYMYCMLEGAHAFDQDLRQLEFSPMTKIEELELLLGAEKSLYDYNKRYEERAMVKNEQQKVNNILAPGG